MERDYTIIGPNGRELTITGPDNASAEQLRAAAERAFGAAPPADQRAKMIRSELMASPPMAVARGVKDLIDTGAHGLAWAYDKVTGSDEAPRIDAMNKAGRAEFDAATAGRVMPQVARLGGNLAGVMPALTTAGAAIATKLPQLGRAVASGGFSTGAAAPVGLAAKAGDMAIRTVGGGAAGYGGAGMVNREDAGTGGVIGATLPGALKIAGAGGNLVGKAGRAIVGQVSPEVAALAKRAEQLGIKIPVDRITNSKPMNAAAASLNYMPFSGRAGTEDAMFSSMNKALSRTFGQNSDNVTMALRRAKTELGDKFDDVLQKNTVKMSPGFKSALAAAEDQANNELGPEAASIIRKQIAQLQTKGASGAIDGQAAYNIKKALDRIGNGNSDAAFYARDLKKKLMDALNESLGQQEAGAFAKVRQQYGNMLALENLAANGAEGGVSIGRLANLKHINNPDLQELADIAAQFLKTRESPHGALQRLVIGGTAAAAAQGLGALPMLPLAAGAGRATNSLLNSQAARNAALGVSGQPNALQSLLANPDFVQLGYRAAPVASTGL